ncbi:ornithine cyclodeaminase [Aminobacter lissarensis]|uniref:Ornithine cyclodeaminase n=1 Tax=Aminobacter carboxidus TaxID=376165 RepID=A0A8E1WEK4_9HYPH|nr:ornithine cyclodeaminase family protein [Aminobacter lissarensis]MBB6466121.1 ornithine cyclodeaminase [Aminobacter lissarensis]
MLILNRQAVAAALPMADCIDAMRIALADFANGGYRLFPRQQLNAGPGEVLMGLMPAFSLAGGEKLWCLKDVLVAHDNAARGLDNHQGAVLLNDGETGQLRAVLDATEITARRTAATSAVATAALARPNARTVAILGTGTQAETHIEALRHVIPEAAFVLWGRSPDKLEELARKSGGEVADSARGAVAEADVICTLTGSKEPIIELGWLKPGCHINAVGSSNRAARELGDDIVAASAFFVDSRSQAAIECGELLQPLERGVIGPDHARAELGEVLAGLRPGRSSPQELTVFKSLGIAVEDAAAAIRAVSNATDRGLGQRVDW